jgi:hypothetical protein
MSKKSKVFFSFYFVHLRWMSTIVLVCLWWYAKVAYSFLGWGFQLIVQKEILNALEVTMF